MSNTVSLFSSLAQVNVRRPPYLDFDLCPPPQSGDGLTERERDILLMTSLGLCNKVISRRMNISVRTVEHYRNSLRRKLGTGTLSRMDAMVQVMLQTSSARISELLNIDMQGVER